MRNLQTIRRNKLHLEAEGYLELGLPQYAYKALCRLGDPSCFRTRTRYLWGEALRGLERYDEAIEPLEDVVARQVDHIPAWLALGWCYKRLNRLDLAIGAIEGALEHEPEEPLLHYNLACYLSLARHKDRAVSELAHALSLDANYRALVDDEPDFDPIRHEPEFQSVASVVV